MIGDKFYLKPEYYHLYGLCKTIDVSGSYNNLQIIESALSNSFNIYVHSPDSINRIRFVLRFESDYTVTYFKLHMFKTSQVLINLDKNRIIFRSAYEKTIFYSYLEDEHDVDIPNLEHEIELRTNLFHMKEKL